MPKPKRHAVDGSQNELADKQEETSGGQLVEALQLLGTVEDGGNSRSADCRSTRFERGTLNGRLGASARRLGDEGTSRGVSNPRGNSNSRGSSAFRGNGNPRRGSDLGAGDSAGEGNGDSKSSRRGLRGVAGSCVRAADSLGLSLGFSLGLGLGSGSRGRNSAGGDDGEGPASLITTARLSLSLRLGGGDLRSARGDSQSDADGGGRDLRSTGGLNSGSHTSHPNDGGRGTRSAGGLLDRESNASDTSQDGRDRLSIANRKGDTSDLGNGCYNVRTGTR